MLNSELYSAALRRAPVRRSSSATTGATPSSTGCRPGQGAPGFNNLFVDARGPGAAADGGLRVDFAAHAAGAGLHGGGGPARRHRRGPARRLRSPPARAAQQNRRPAVVVCRTHPTTWTEAGAWWEVGVPAALPGRAGVRGAQGRPAAVAGVSAAPLRAGVIGFGWMGRVHAMAYAPAAPPLPAARAARGARRRRRRPVRRAPGRRCPLRRSSATYSDWRDSSRPGTWTSSASPRPTGCTASSAWRLRRQASTCGSRSRSD